MPPGLRWKEKKVDSMTERHMVIPVFIPHKGCPFDCIYCNQKTISGQTAEMTEERMRAVIESHLLSATRGAFIEIGFYGGSFTGIEQSQQIKFLKIAGEYVAKGRVREIRLSTRPDYINVEILDCLKEYPVGTIELGVQSLDRNVLLQSCRGHTVEDVWEASRLIKQYGFTLGIQTMIGLPGDTREKALDTARMVMDMAPQVVRIYPTLVIRDTYLEKMFQEGLYQPMGLEAAVELCAELLEMYEPSGIKVIRIGLQPTENINEQMDVTAGPFHPAFRQLVESRRMLGMIEKLLEEGNLTEEKNIIIYTKNKAISEVIGQKKGNIRYLTQKYRFGRIRVIPEEDLEEKVRITAER